MILFRLSRGFEAKWDPGPKKFEQIILNSPKEWSDVVKQAAGCIREFNDFKTINRCTKTVLF